MSSWFIKALNQIITPNQDLRVMPSPSPWNTYTTPDTWRIVDKVIQFDDDILWYSSDYGHEKNKEYPFMIEFSISKNKVKSMTKYPIWAGEIIRKYLCGYNNTIYIIDICKDDCQIISFCPYSKEFTKKIQIPSIWAAVTSVVINDEIHIFGTSININSIKLIYSPKYNTVRAEQDPMRNYLSNMKNVGALSGVKNVSMVSYDDKLIRFGGSFWTGSNHLSLDWFVQSSNFTAPNVEWKLIEKYKLPFPMQFGRGYIIYQHFIITFGGLSNKKRNMLMDDIFVLNLEPQNSTVVHGYMRTNSCSIDIVKLVGQYYDNGWRNINEIKCPKRCNYKVILTLDENIHLFDESIFRSQFDVNGHYSIPLSTIKRYLY
eukprot:220462_1